jgi:parallel beta-helix repeat protein
MLAAAAVLVVSAGVGAAEKTWYVDDGGDEGINFTKIQDAVNAAGDGDTIYVYAGIYDECLIVYKSLMLQGENRETTIIDANGGNKGIEITANDCVISGFTIRNCWDTGIKPASSSNGSIITNNIIHSIIGSSDTDGIEVTISSHNIISNNEIFDCDDEGIEMDGSSHNTITFNDIYLNGGDGIKLKNSSNNTITNNNISLNDETGMDIEDSSSYNFITNNNVFDNYDEGIELDLDGSHSYNYVTGNNIFNNSDDGIDLEEYSSYNFITSNNIFDNHDDGVDLDAYCSHNSITSNNIFNNNNDGVDINFSSNNVMIGNIMSSNGDNGIRIKLSNNNRIYHNNFLNNADQANDNGNNFWDNGYPSGGNYWSDRSCTGNPSDGSQPYTIGGGAGAVDHYPFESMNGWLTAPQTGDLNSDGSLSPTDAAIALAIAASGARDDAADVSGDGSVTSLDALMILQTAAENMEL